MSVFRESRCCVCVPAARWSLEPGAVCSVAVCCLDRVLMMISEGMREQVDGKAGDDDEFQALRMEVLSLRKARKQQSETESSLIQELQRRCNRIIELEVKLKTRLAVRRSALRFPWRDGGGKGHRWVLSPWAWE